MRNNPFEVTLLVSLFVFFLIAWALSQLLNKEAPPTPNRPQPFAPNPRGAPVPSRPLERRPGLGGGFDAAGRWSNAPPGNAIRPLPNASEEVIILSSETLREPLATSVRPPVGSAAARGRPVKRGKPAAAPPAPGRAEPARPRTMLSGVSQSVDQALAKPMDVRPLFTGQALLTGATAESAHAAISKESGSVSLATTALRDAMRSKDRLREALLLNELLQPPLALRGRTRGR